ncbi:MAG TPA: hypothetical protein VKM55_21495 [Candidatus Lokiarchaeia archaeon]|nr:hypothetical protein [Candidatus Lokiarchaeia archaeon]
MIENLFVVTETGICVFAYHAEGSSRLNLDENLVSGFLSAITLFTQETFHESNLMKVEISRRKKIVIYNPPRDEAIRDQETLGTKLRIYAVTNFYDHDRLIKKLLKEIFTRFHEKFKNDLTRDHMNESSLFETFSNDINQMLAGKTYPRAKKQFRLGLIVAFILIAVPLVLEIYFGPDFTSIENSGLKYDEVIKFLVIVGSIAAAVMFTSGVIGGYIAGSRKDAMRMGFTLAAIAFALIVLASFRQGITFFGIAVVLLVYLGLIGIVGCFIGGSFRDLRALWPVEATPWRHPIFDSLLKLPDGDTVSEDEI